MSRKPFVVMATTEHEEDGRFDWPLKSYSQVEEALAEAVTLTVLVRDTLAKIGPRPADGDHEGWDRWSEQAAPAIEALGIGTFDWDVQFFVAKAVSVH